MPKMLKFKGDGDEAKRDKKRKSKSDPEERAKRLSRKQAREEEAVVNPWPQCESDLDIKGPMFVYHPGPPQSVLTSLEYEGISWRKGKAGSAPAVQPSHVSQVFVIQRIHPDSKYFTVKNSADRFLGTDSIGQWEIVKTPDGSGFAFKSHFNFYLKYDASDAVAVRARADSPDIGPLETFTLHCQAGNKTTFVKPKEKEKLPAQLEFDNLRTFHSLKSSSFGERDLKRSKDDIEQLRRAKEQGNLNELLLDRRQKTKSDKFC